MYLTQALHRLCQQSPDRPLTIYGERTRTVAESSDRVARLAAALSALGVAAEDRVGILALNSDRYHEILLAVPWADAVVNPVNIRWSIAEIAYSLADCDTRVIFVDDAFAAAIPALREQVPNLRTVISCSAGSAPDGTLDYERLIAAHQPVEDVRRGGSALYGIFYTGGTTGQPKGVMLSHNAILASAMGSLTSVDLMTRGGRLLHAAPMFHLADLATWNVGLLTGSTHVIIPTFTPDGVAEAVATHRVTDMLLVPTMIQLLTDAPQTAAADLTSVRRVVYGASPISQAVLSRARQRMPGAAFTQAYGMTELAPIATLLAPEDHDEPRLARSAGRAVAHVEVRILDPEDTVLPVGEVGEIAVRGDGVMAGYWNQPEQTAAALRGGWMHTGDGGYLDERGYLFVVDRIKDMIITGGENVYSAEVENALGRHEAVATCAVIGLPDEQWGERVHAVVVLQPDARASAEELREFCRAHIANYKIPRTIEFADALPMSGAGKVLKRELRRTRRQIATRARRPVG